MSNSLKVLLRLGLALGCLSYVATSPSTTTRATTMRATTTANAELGSTTVKPPQETSLNKSEETGISHIIKHSKLFTEFVSFAVNPVKSMELVDAVKTNILAGQPATSSEEKEPLESAMPSSNQTSSESVTAHINSSPVLQELFIEMAKSNSPGFVVSFDYLNVTSKSAEAESMSRKPVRMWGILPDELNNKTVYFLADYYKSTSYDADTKDSAKEQIDDFELWKNETLSSDDFSDDKLGDGTIAALLGGY